MLAKTVSEIRPVKAMKPQMVRLPEDVCDQAIKKAKELSTSQRKITVTDLYRTAILIYFGVITTDSSNQE